MMITNFSMLKLFNVTFIYLLLCAAAAAPAAAAAAAATITILRPLDLVRDYPGELVPQR